ncbi:hypothetical protein CTI12_AA414660 [Artemisia annua]|uniref:Uncharacterized protein n=1 Tax=Artemisia annua TaxID=35608 RepID=A0A2U1M659_ARTAN|nr:hypothetical protein CTI12_AA414660 [Artemisia annua]
MVKRRVSSGEKAKDRESWKNIFKGLFDMIQKQQRQIESFVRERKSLEKRIKSLHERWAFDVNLLQDHISQMKRDMKVKDMVRYVGDEHGVISVLKHEKDIAFLVLPYHISAKSLTGKVLIAYESGLIILWDILEAQVVVVRGDKVLELKNGASVNLNTIGEQR